MRKFVEKVQLGGHLTYPEMEEASKILFDEQTDAGAIKDFLIGLSEKGETAQEVAALASVMRSYALKFPIVQGDFTDNCGTGGDGSDSFNISTTAAFVVAGAGAKVAKHGNRKVSSKAGSSDVLEALGIRLDLKTEEMAQMLEEIGLTFLYAPQVHPKLKRIGTIRQEIGKPTIFNLVGPLTNPAPLATQFTGISRPDFTMEYASVLQMLGRKRAVVVSGTGGMDEASLAGQNSFVLLDDGDLIPFSLRPEDVGLIDAAPSTIRGGDAKENAEIIYSVLKGERGPRFDTVVFNAGIGLFAHGTAKTIEGAVELAKESILSGKALEKLEAVIEFSQKVSEKEVVK